MFCAKKIYSKCPVVYIQNPHPQHYLDLGWSIGHSFVSISPRYVHAGNVQLPNSSRLEFSDILAAIGLADAILNAVDFALGGKPRVDRDCYPDPWRTAVR